MIITPPSVDWKYLLTIIAAIAGVLVPVLIWRADLSSKAVAVRIASQTQLQPKSAAPLTTLHVTVGGVPLKDPYLTVFTITNSGDRPIQATDFEGPIQILGTGATKLALLQAGESKPDGIVAEAVLSDGVAALKPLLLNPGDELSIAIVTSDGLPTFFTRGRIAGVKEIEFDSRSATDKQRRLLYLKFPVATLLFISYSFTFMCFMAWPRMRLKRITHLLIAVPCAIGGLLLSLEPLIKEFDFSTYEALTITIAIVTVGTFLAVLGDRKPRSSTNVP